MSFGENKFKEKYLNENNLFTKSLNFQFRQTILGVMVLTLTQLHESMSLVLQEFHINYGK